MEKITIIAIAFFVIALFLGIFFVNGQLAKSGNDKTAMDYVNEDSSLKSTNLQQAQMLTPQKPNTAQTQVQSQTQPQMKTASQNSYNIDEPNNTVSPLPSKSPTPKPIPTLSPTPSSSNEPLAVNCDVDKLTGVMNKDEITWTAYNPTGGNGQYTYKWSGDESVEGKTGAKITVTYTTTGTKKASVTVTSDGQSTTCKAERSVTITDTP